MFQGESTRSTYNAQHRAHELNAMASTSTVSSPLHTTQPVAEWAHPLSQDAPAGAARNDEVYSTASEERGPQPAQTALSEGDTTNAMVQAARTAASPGNSTAGNLAGARADGVQIEPAHDGEENEAISVRRHMLRNAWDGFTLLTRFRRWIFVLRFLIALTQIAAGIAVLALPSSLGDSVSFPETCDPEGMFVYLVLHCARVACSIPVDVYLGLSPHRSPRARRRGADGLMERERDRRVGSLRLDRKIGRMGDLLGFCHVVLFIVGNYVVWTSVECSRSPADSRPLFFTCVAMLCITYVLVFEVALMIFLVVCFLPLIIATLNALGLSHRLPHRDIHPETGKINQDDIEKHSKLVYYTPAESADEEGQRNAHCPSSSGDSPDRSGDDQEVTFARKLSMSTGLDLQSTNGVSVAAVHGNEQDTPAATSLPLHPATALPLATTESIAPQQPVDVTQQPKRRRLGRLFGLHRLHTSSTSLKSSSGTAASPATDAATLRDTKYPLHSIPAHRATCPICLCDYEEVPSTTAKSQAVAQTSSSEVSPPPGAISSPPEPEPLRLLSCGHVMHMSCVDQWLTAVSGRCPVCQRAIVGSAAATEGNDEA